MGTGILPNRWVYKLISLGILGLGIFFWGASFGLADHEFQRELEIRTKEIDAQNLNHALSLEQILNRSFFQADSILQLVKAEIETDGILDPYHVKLIQDFLKPGIFNQIAVSDARGNLLYSAVPLTKSINISDREHFRGHVTENSGKMLITAPIITRATGSESLFLSRRLNDAGGNFAGIVSVGISTDYFTKMLQQMQLGTFDSFVMLTTEGVLLARFPGESSVGFRTAVRTHPVIARIAQGDSLGRYESRGTADGIVRIGAFRKLSDYPVVALVGIPKIEAFRVITERGASYRILAGLFSLLLGLLLLLLWRQFRKQYRAEVALWAQNSELDRKVMERTVELEVAYKNLASLNAELEQRVQERTSSLTEAYRELATQHQAYCKTQESLEERETSYYDLVNTLPDGIALRNELGVIYYANQVFAEMVQAENPSELVGMPYLDFVHPEDREESIRRIKINIRGSLVPWREHRLLGLQGRILEVNSTSVPTTYEGKPCQSGIFHDITGRRKNEARLVHAARVQEVVHEIAEAAVQTVSLSELYEKVHTAVKKVLPAKNFYIMLLEDNDTQFVIPYCVDTTNTIPQRRCAGKGLAEYVMRQRCAICVTPAELASLRECGEIQTNLVNYSNWAGAPLMDSTGKAFGIIALFLVDEDERTLLPEDLQVLSTIAAQVALAIERKKSLVTLIESEARYRAIIEQAPEAVLLCDPLNGDILEANSRFVEMSGYDLYRDDPLNLYDLILDSRQNIQVFQDELKHTGVLPVQRRVGTRRNGTAITFERSARMIHYRGRSLVVAMIRDISTDVRREEEILRDAKLATRVQRAMLPTPSPSDYLEIDTVFNPFAYVGGDLYFLDWRYGGKLLRGFLVDSTGHGLGTALHTAALHVLLREVNERDLPVSDAMRWLNNRAGQYFDDGTFTGALCFELDLQTRQLRWVCAGIHQIWMSTKNGPATLKYPGMLLGICEDELFETHTISVDIGDAFYFMTDGLTDLIGERTELPLDRYPAMLGELKTLSVSTECRDDATAICVRVKALPQTMIRQDGWPRIIRVNGFGEYQRLHLEVAKIFAEVTGKPHSLQEVAVNEALANAMECRDGVPRKHEVRLRCNKVGNRFIVRVKSSRMGFAGNSVLRRLRSHPEEMFAFGEDAGMGRGIPMMLTISDQMMYNTDGTEVLLAWKL